ncbi:MAG TPA: PspC domain-containing protein [Melioribacteraceae bacterium]|nr:PspC domain-containing protein [Melioribacteraceae bacterium]
MNEYKEQDDYKNAEDAEFIEIKQTANNSSKKLSRSANNKIIFGVCGGLGEYYLIHPLIFRLIFVISFFYSSYTVFLYGFFAIFMKNPKTDETKNQKFSIFMGYSVLLFSAVYYVANNSRLFKYFLGAIDPTIYITFIFAFLGLYIILEANRFYQKDATILRIKLYKYSNNRIIGGVCFGISKYLELSATKVRFIFIISTLLTFGLFAVAYLVLFFVLPKFNEY